ncbi:exonuclease SbcCD subunit D C-terminal domain-containing protein [Lewinella sp. JB7]|uniref:exonuclease SbcCD subunit D C-terminal domain-containing protein n=1 Tax=Lewinella sp. JB7 TaxID=2962887 RepID=UPI0020C944F2|nr:exonuclease SbcCD subunit D C-terminal domain-containing protein [Lewinella sp. JB7]MCP9236502.1 exonuclease SbcCD subunit D C-terminal domain-containing protein [Lewinella sp. JB7]
MRILHTADWHLGHRLYNRDRTPEHRAALEWLLRTIDEERIDLLVVAGDVFDVTNPSNQARELYYEFLARLIRTSCTSAVIVGGNHDSASQLDAPRELLRHLQLHVIGAATTEASARVIPIRCGEEELLVAAVPYLRERDLRTSTFGESHEDRLRGLRNGIDLHFQSIARAACAYRGNKDIPIIATGHLFVAGASDDEEKKSYIYQADTSNIDAGQFPECFDYVALGHVHRAQHVGDHQHIRYAGSLVPLTFVEGQAARSVRIVDLGKAGQPVTSRKINLPGSRTLLRLHGELPDVLDKLRAAAAATPPEDDLTPWAEVRVRTDKVIPNLRDKLMQAIQDGQQDPRAKPVIELLRISRERLTAPPTSVRESVKQLDELEPDQVFRQLCTSRGQDDATVQSFLADFRELRSWVSEEGRAT